MKFFQMASLRFLILTVGVLAACTARADVVATNSGSLGSSANGAHGAGTTLQRTGALAGSNNKAVSYDGINAGTLASFVAALNPQGPFAVELWVKPDTIPVPANTPCPVSSAQFNGDRSGWQIRQRDTGYEFVLYNHVGGNTAANILGGGVPSTNTWTHLVGVYDGSTAYLYVNGVLANSASAAGFIANYNDGVNSPGPLTIGYRSSLNNNFDGLVDEVAIYTNALSALTIAAHYDNGTNAFPGTPYDALILADGPAAYYRLDENQLVPYRDYVLDLSPLAYYRLNEAHGTAANIGTLGAAADGTYTGGTLMTEVAGPRPAGFPGFESNNAAITVNGGWVDINNPPAMDISGQFTFQAWIRIPATSALDTPGHIGNIVAHGYSTADFMETTLRVRNNGGTRVYNVGTFNSVNWSDAGASFTVPGGDIGGEWVYLAGIWDGTQFNLYHNGIRVATGLDPLNQGAWSTSTGEWGIGARANGPDRMFDGSIDEVAVFNYALTEAEVWAVYTNATGVSGLAPIITAQPTGDTNLYAGESHVLSVAASGMPAPTYQWRKNGTNILGATGTTYSLNPAAVGDTGDYDVIVANIMGSVTSSVAQIVVYDPTLLVSSSAYRNFILSLSPLAYYRLDEDAAGLIAANIGTLGSAVDGTYSGSVTSMVRSVRPPPYPGFETNSKAVTFSGNGFVNIPNDTGMNFTGAVTMVAWLKLPSTATWGIGNIVAHGYGSEFNETVLRLNGNSYEVGNYRGTCCWSGVNAGSTIPAGDFGGDWVFLAGTWDGAQWNLYRNGDLVGTIADAFGAVQTDGLWGIGARASGPDRFVGSGVSVDEVAVFNYALTPSQVRDAYAYARTGTNAVPPLVVTQPVGNTNLYVGESHTLSVVASGSPVLSYQWRKGGVNLSAATNTSFALSPAAVADSGNYDVIIANPYGSVTSLVATVTVYDPTTLSSSSAYRDFVLTLGPLAYYRLDEAGGTAANIGSLGSAADGAYTGTITYQVLGIRPPAAAGFETNSRAIRVNNGWVDLNNPSGLDISNDFTFQAWIKIPATSGLNSAGHIGNIVAHGYSSSDYMETVLRVRNNGGTRVYNIGTFNSVNWSDAGVSFNIPAGDIGGEWVHLVGTYDGVQFNLYRNGTLVAAAADPLNQGAWPTAFGEWGIGANVSDTGPGRFFDGSIDEVAIFDYALSPSQVRAQYNLGRFGNAALILNITISGANHVITWPGEATLQSATNVLGPYLDVSGATSPYIVPLSGTAQYFRLKE